VTAAGSTLWARVRAGDFELLTDRELWLVALGAAAVLASLLWLLFSWLEPPPPKRVRITTGSETGAYFSYGKKYAEALKKHGITLEVMPSKGSVENLQRLTDTQTDTREHRKAAVMVGLLQSGVGDAETAPDLEGLASVAYEPIWVFHKPASPGARLSGLRPLLGQRVAIGPEGSGTRVAALKLLKANGLDASNTTLLPLSGSEATQALARGELDAAFVVAAADAPLVVQALDAGLEPVSFATADAYVRQMPWLTRVVLPRGVVNLARNLPREDVVLVASTATLVVHKDLHPAIAFLLMDVAADVHKVPALTNAPREFPNERAMDFAQSAESQRYFKTGRPFLQRYLPFWLANLLERLAVTLVPALAVAIPLVQFLPRYLGWREKSHILRLYHELELLQDAGQLNAAHLDRVEAALARLPLGVDRYVDAYNLKGHLDMMRARLSAGAAQQA
jgi:TRAP transporter TAXI family solute receptor